MPDALADRALAREPMQAADDGVDWAAVRDDYLYSGMAQRRIAHRHGMSAAKLRTRRVAEGWERVMPCVPLATWRATPRDGEPPTPTQKRRARLSRRVYAVLEKKMAELERRMIDNTTGAQSAAEIERGARALTALMQVYAKLVVMDEAAQAANKTANENAGTTGARTEDDADRLRRDLAERLARINAAER